MKNKIKTIITLFSILTIWGCSKDYLELSPVTNKMEENYYKTESDALYALASIYQVLAVHNGYEFLPMSSDILSDDAFAGGSNASDMLQWHQAENGLMTTENITAEKQWARCYTGIYRANLLLEKMNQINWIDSSKITRIESEIRFCRAYFYWDLVRLFGWVPIITKNFPDIESYKRAGQNTPAQVYNQITKDLLIAISGLPGKVSAEETGRATSYAARALLSRIYLFYQGFVKPVLNITGEMTDSVTVVNKAYIKSALDSIIEHGGYELLDNYADVFSWTNQNNAESLFELQYSEKGKSGNWNADYWDVFGNISVIMCGVRDPEGDPSIASGWSFSTLTWSLVKEFEAGDTRKEVTIYNADSILSKYTHAYQNTGYFNKKFMPLSAYNAELGSRELNYPRNHPDIRYSDVLLMAAEIYLEDNPSKAADYLNLVRKRAMGEAAAKGSITLDDIYHERRVELAGEGHRYWDLLRRGLSYTQTKITESKILPEGIENASDFQDVKFVSETWGMYPIPASEVRKTYSGTLSQYIPAFK